MADGPKTCDSCRSLRKDADHWFLIWLENFTYKEAETEQSISSFRTVPWSEQVRNKLKEDKVSFNEYCGQSCSQKAFEKFLQAGHQK